jgi:hypothetical protein
MEHYLFVLKRTRELAPSMASNLCVPSVINDVRAFLVLPVEDHRSPIFMCSRMYGRITTEQDT